MSRKNSNNIDYAVNTLVKIFIITALVISIGILMVTFINFYGNQRVFTDNLTETLYSFADNDSEIVSATDELLTLRIQYLERISEMHKQASSNDLFVFMYGFISSVLIGVSAYMVKKGQEQSEVLCSKYADLNGVADSIEQRLKEQERYTQFNMITQVLSEALISILSYSISKGNGNLTRFKQSLKDVSDLCKNGDFTNIDKTAIATFGRTLQTIEGVYFSNADEATSEIDSTHREFIKLEFESIKKMLTDRHK